MCEGSIILCFNNIVVVVVSSMTRTGLGGKEARQIKIVKEERSVRVRLLPQGMCPWRRHCDDEVSLKNNIDDESLSISISIDESS